VLDHSLPRDWRERDTPADADLTAQIAAATAHDAEMQGSNGVWPAEGRVSDR
jgi:hypothetical protein